MLVTSPNVESGLGIRNLEKVLRKLRGAFKDRSNGEIPFYCKACWSLGTAQQPNERSFRLLCTLPSLQIAAQSMLKKDPQRNTDDTRSDTIA